MSSGSTSGFTIEKSKLSDKLGALDHQVHLDDNPLPLNNNFIWIITGSKGTGKSSLMLQMLGSEMRRKYNHIYLISPTSKNDPKFDKLVDELEEDGKYYPECNEANLTEIVESIKSSNEDDKKNKNLLILDDCIANLKGSSSKSILNKIITTTRHLKTTIIISTQKYVKLNNLIRANADLISIFATSNRKEYETIQDDFNIAPKLFKQVYDYAIGDGGHNFLHLKVLGGKPQFFKRFDRIILTKSE